MHHYVVVAAKLERAFPAVPAATRWVDTLPKEKKGCHAPDRSGGEQPSTHKRLDNA